jgi:hypothetical protein
MLLRDSPLTRGSGASTFSDGGWGQASDLVERIASVTTIAAPHFGTGLAESPLGRLVAGHPSPAALRDAALALFSVTHRGDLGSRMHFALSATPGLTKMPFFLARMLIMNELAADLRPEALGALSQRAVRRSAEGRVFSVATVAPRPAVNHADKLFRQMWSWTDRGSRGVASSEVSGLDDIDLRLPALRSLVLPPVGPGDNDGVVTTQRQVLGELIGVVVGDHVDVLGRYRRMSLVDGKVIDPGLLTSGATFGDDEFFGLLLRVGDRVAKLVH